MKTIQITMDEHLLKRLDSDDETKRDGRSAVLRRAAADYLSRRRRAGITDSYRRAYAGKQGIGTEFQNWEKEGQWPDE